MKGDKVKVVIQLSHETFAGYGAQFTLNNVPEAPQAHFVHKMFKMLLFLYTLQIDVHVFIPSFTSFFFSVSILLNIVISPDIILNG